MDADHPRSPWTWIALGATYSAAFAVFFLVQRSLSVSGNTFAEGNRIFTGWAPVRMDLRIGSLRFLAASFAMAALICGARRLTTFAVPILIALALPALTGGVPDCVASSQGKAPYGIGPGWNYSTFLEGCGYRLFATWTGFAVDFALVLFPAIVLALIIARRTVARPAPNFTTGSAALAISFCFLASVAIFNWRITHDTFDGAVDWRSWFPIYACLFVFGTLLGVRRSWWTAALVIVPVAFFPLEVGFTDRFEIFRAANLVVITVIAASWRPLAMPIERARGRLHSSRRPITTPV